MRIEMSAFYLTVAYAFCLLLFERVEDTWMDVIELVFDLELRDQTQLSLVSHPIHDHV